MSVVQRKAMLKAEGFFPHKKNAKGTTIIYSRKHPTAKFVRVVIDSGIDSKTNKVIKNAGIKLCYINRTKSWREITTEISTDNKGLVNLIGKVEAAEKFVKTCKFCKAKKFTAKTGNTVCANACWVKWGGKKKSATSKKTTQKKSATRAEKKKTQKVTPKNQRTYPANKSTHKKAATSSQKIVTKSYKKSSQKKPQKIVAEILPGDLVSVEGVVLGEIHTDYTGSILGVVMKVDKYGAVEVNWTANTSELPAWDMPFTNHYTGGSGYSYRFKVLSRSIEWTVAA